MLGACIAFAGIATISGGIVGLVHCDRTGPTFFGGNICIQNDWAFAGVMGVLMGIVVLILGIVLPYATAPAPPPKPVTYAAVPVMGAYMAPYPPQFAAPYGSYAPAYPGYGQPQVYAPYPAAQSAPAAAGTTAPRACTKCGAQVTSQFCASCGAQQW